jgi:hypothetical protein
MRLLLALLIAAALAAPAGRAAPKPHLVLTVAQPPTVRGTHFAARERVRVTFTAGGDGSVRSIRTSRSGAFVARAPGDFAYSPCGAPLVVVAIGARGDRATLKVPQRECPSA